MSKSKKITEKVLSLLCIIIAIITIVILVTVYRSRDKGIPVLGGRTMLLVLSPSMEPEYMAYTCVFVKETDVTKLKIGDDISFYSEDPSIYMKLVTHRIVEIEDTSDGPLFTTKGINNSAVDGYKVPKDKIVGKVTGQSKVLGSFVSAISQTEVFICLIAIPIVLMVVVNVLAFKKRAKEIAVREMMEGSPDYRYFTLEEEKKESLYADYMKLQAGRSGPSYSYDEWKSEILSNHFEGEISFKTLDDKECIFQSYASCDIYDNLKTFYVFLTAVNEEYMFPGIFKQTFKMQLNLAKGLKCHRIMINIHPEWVKFYKSEKLIENKEYSNTFVTTMEYKL